MNISFHSTVIFVQDIEISKKFYCGFLKQTITEDFGAVITLSSGLSLWQMPEGHRLKENYDPVSSNHSPMEVCFETQTMDEVVEFIHQEGIRLVHGLIEEPWGQRTIRFFDPDNHIVEIGEELPVFIQRMNDEGLSLAEIHQKTGVPMEKIKHLIQ
ncbi:MAG: VOC family protein [Bacteroidales bacterium]|jgi:catechol 2,3-dioxygenase-like lactoylglutathione lyase family enzyme|nr:VOC family protein [Bacteroidales bacterium]